VVVAEPFRFPHDGDDVGEGPLLLPGLVGARQEREDRRDDAELQQ
jgi:hypothetical protein